jgi:hypothetical protein
MYCHRLGIKKRRTTVVLGAGATRGSSRFEGAWCAPPVDTDFFNQVEKLRSLDKTGYLDGLLRFVRYEYGAGQLPPMEKVFTKIEALDDFYGTLKIDKGPRLKSYGTRLEEFTSGIAAAFGCLEKFVANTQDPCEHHLALVDRLETTDTIISFNYDCTIDSALKVGGGKSWDATHGYGFEITGGAELWHDHSGKGATAKRSIELLKLHGSLNWDRSKKDLLRLRADPYDSSDRALGEIIPPVWDKRIGGDPILEAIWKRARKALRDSNVLIIIGYSAPDTDLLSQSLLEVAPAETNDKLKHLVVANPDAACRRKLLDLLKHATNTTTSVTEFESFKNLASCLPTPVA